MAFMHNPGEMRYETPLLAIGAFLIASCGQSSSPVPAAGQIPEVEQADLATTTTSVVDAPQEPPVSTVSERPDIAIPPRISESDDRTPIERYVGIPATSDEARIWDNAIFETAIGECMEEHGFDYAVQGIDDAVDPNEAYISTLSPEKAAEFLGLRYGVPEPPTQGTCVDQAVPRVYVMNAFADEYAPFDAEFSTDPRVAAASAAVVDCLGGASAVDESSPVDVDRCQSAADWHRVGRDVIEEVQTRFIETFRDELDGFIAQRPEVEG